MNDHTIDLVLKYIKNLNKYYKIFEFLIMQR